MLLNDYLIGTWTFTKVDEAQQTPLFALQSAQLESLPTTAHAVYYGVREPHSNSFLLLHNDLDRSALSRQRLMPDGTLNEEGRWSSGGVGGSYIAFDQSGNYFAIANAHTGWAVFRNGEHPEQIAALIHHGSGPHPRQARSHPHCIQFSANNEWIYATDMGSDHVLSFPFEASSGYVGDKAIAWNAPAGAGPRHLLSHRSRVYLLNELNNTLVVLQPQDDGKFELLQTINTLPNDFTGNSHTAHLAVSPDGNALFASNRGHDSISRFSLDDTGMIKSTSWIATNGKWPWFFVVTAENGLLIANTLSDNITFLLPDHTDTYQISNRWNVACPVFLVAC